MAFENLLGNLKPQRKQEHKNIFEVIHIDLLLLIGLFALIITGLFILISASNDQADMIAQQIGRFFVGLGVMFIAAQIPPEKYRIWVPWVYTTGIILLVLVLIFGHTGKGATRWLNLGFVKFQPSEIMKIAVPAMVAWYLGIKELPPKKLTIFNCILLIGAPALLIAKQPDLGTCILIVIAGGGVVLFSGLLWRFILSFIAVIAAGTPILWLVMHTYQRQRVLTFLDPNRDPLGAGYHIIQSKIAIGSGGFFGKGWFNGSQSHLNFLPEHSTDFIFSVLAEEFGFLGFLVLLSIYLFIVGRCFYIASKAPDTFTRLLASSLALTFFVSAFVNIGMVTGILPVVGIPLPLVSYGGTSVVTVMAGFGIIMSIYTHRGFLRGSI
jgi:rod shape determining protein RodA